MENFENINENTIKLMQPLVLAMIGDSVQTLFIREYVAKKHTCKVNKMNKLVSSVVKAGAQFKTFKKLEEELTEAEQDIAKRARNTHVHTKAKNFSYGEYIYATALEALIGYHYLLKNEERLNQILTLSLEELEIEE